ncbi:hypothetical protein E2C01_065371 [Portunus trituberculatus]|uniref:Uncharacterized protein n=1 Tax=Portunus trituberculatus TaxID=210409 RepID=A0A5B7HIN3_PORTR|nr:hypothetical protein [Portunus trituberculatus]
MDITCWTFLTTKKNSLKKHQFASPRIKDKICLPFPKKRLTCGWK